MTWDTSFQCLYLYLHSNTYSYVSRLKVHFPPDKCGRVRQNDIITNVQVSSLWICSACYIFIKKKKLTYHITKKKERHCGKSALQINWAVSSSFICKHICMVAYIYVYVCICIHKYSHIHILTHTYTFMDVELLKEESRRGSLRWSRTGAPLLWRKVDGTGLF